LAWRDFIPIDNLAAFSRHLISDCCALFVFWVATSLAARLFPKYDYVIVKLEIFGLILIIGTLLYHLVKDVAKGGPTNAPRPVLLT
jgi:hypothetical protein